MKQNLLPLVVVAAILAFSGRTVSAANIVQNGDFTDNASSFTGLGYFGGSNPTTLPHYDVSAASGGLGGYGTMAYENFQPSGYSQSAGDPSVYLFLQGNNTKVTQALTLNPFTTYTLSFEAGVRAGYGPIDGLASITDAGVLLGMPTLSFTGSSNTDFVAYTTTFSTGADVSNALLTLENAQTGGGDHTVDFADVSLTANPSVPEPTSLALLGLGAAALLFVSRRAAQKS